MDSEEHISKYSLELQSGFKSLAIKIQELLSSILADNQITTHSITAREKSLASLRNKINKEAKSYINPLDEITDLAGVRIITYFPSEVDKIIPIIEKQFTIDRKNSIDKRKTTDPAAFGYASVHLVVELSSDRTKLPEYTKFKGMKCEIQVRTILQHAWAEIEHDIVYKSNEDIPFELRRKFASLSGLLEIADREFESLRQEEIKVRGEILQTIKQENIDIPVDLDSLRFYLEKFHDEKHLSEYNLSKLNRLIHDRDIKTIEELNKIFSRSLISNSAQEANKFMDVCPGANDCLLKYILALGSHFNINRKEIGSIIRCPALIDEISYKNSRLIRKGLIKGKKENVV